MSTKDLPNANRNVFNHDILYINFITLKYPKYRKKFTIVIYSLFDRKWKKNEII